MPQHDPIPSPDLSRRRVVGVVGGAAALGGAGMLAAGCSTVTPTTRSNSDAAAGVAGTELGAATDVPVGSAAIFDEQGVVVTQATAGEFAAFSAVCPHQGCNVASVEGGSIICPCHNSVFALDGTVTTGPAQTGLAPRAVTVEGGRITLA
ncbi:MAG: Rieske (2Fe-2S) protein [Pseudonocardia sp.]|nr:Rieske (2Fe-2S) protein [Pseudonocardia sp.]